MVEHTHGKGEVIGSIPIIGSRMFTFKKEAKDIFENLLGLIIILVVIIAAVYFLDFEKIQSNVSIMGIWAPFVLIFLKMITIVFAPLSGSPLYPLAGAVFGFWHGALYIVIGDALGALISFGISRRFGKPLVERMLARKNMVTAEKIIGTIESAKGFLFARICFSAMPEIISYAAGLTKIPFWRFFIIHNLVGLIPTLILVGSGNILTQFKDPLFVALFFALGIIFVFLGGYLFFKFTKSKNL